jgi:Flp pilus assembly protein TadG
MRKRVRSFIAGEDGGVLIMTALSLPLLVMAIGCAIDYSRASLLKTRLQDAADAAVLLAAKQAPSMNDADLLTATTKAFKANVTDPTAKIDSLKISNGRRKVELTASADAKPTFMGAVAFASLPIKSFSASVTADNHYEIALVIDNSGSMGSSAGGKSKMQSAKDAANKLIDSMMGTQSASTKTKFSIVPFTLAVNVGSQYASASWIDTQGQSSIHWQNLDKANSDWKPASRFDIFSALGVSWAGCVETRPGSWGVNDGAPSAATPDSLVVPMFAPDEPGDAGDTFYQPDLGTWWSYSNSYLNDNPKKECKDIKSNPNEYAEAETKLCKYQNLSSLTTSGGRGPNYNCNAKPLLRLTNDTTALHTSVNAMQANGNTNLLEGFMWGWRTISPNSPFPDAKPYKTVDNDKIIILLTDGMNVWGSANNHNKSVYSPFGWLCHGKFEEAQVGHFQSALRLP